VKIQASNPTSGRLEYLEGGRHLQPGATVLIDALPGEGLADVRQRLELGPAVRLAKVEPPARPRTPGRQAVQEPPARPARKAGKAEGAPKRTRGPRKSSKPHTAPDAPNSGGE
jgi:hypothetical protein